MTSAGPQARKKVCVRLRPNLTLTEVQDGGEVQYTLQDPVSLRYFRLDERQRFLVDRMDGTHTLDAIRKAYEQRYRPERLSLEELEAFAAELLQAGLVRLESEAAGSLLIERARRQQEAGRRQRWLHFLSIQVPLCNPDALLGRLLAWCRPIFTLPFLLVALGLMAVALGLVVTHWEDFVARLPVARSLLSWHMLLFLWITLGLVKILHELAHGLCCKAMGGDVPEMGLLLLFFFPTLYCDVSDSWRIGSRWRRMAIGAAGILTELCLAAAATLLWWFSDPASSLHLLCMSVMLVCGVQTLLVNGNPLMRFDGYHVLADFLAIPNLAERSGATVRQTCLAWLGLERIPSAERRSLFLGYALASYAYRCCAALAGMLLLAAWLQPYKLAALAYVVGGFGLAVVALAPLLPVAQRLAGRTRLRDMRWARLVGVGVAAALLVLAAVFVPLPMHVHGRALVQIEPVSQRRVVVPQAGGFLDTLLVRDGQSVQAGEVLAVLRNPELEIKLQVNEADQALRLQQRSAHLAELAGNAPDAATGLQHIDAELQALTREGAVLREEQAALVLRAPCSGIVADLVPLEAKGKFLEPGATVCRVGNPAHLRAVLLVAPADRDLIARGDPAWIHLRGAGLHGFSGTVADVAQVDAGSIPPQLSTRAGGDVASAEDPVSKSEKPYQPVYLTAVRFLRAPVLAHPGVLCQVRIDTKPQTLAWLIRRYLGTTFNWGL